MGKGDALMTIEDKTFLLNICALPRLGLNQAQIGAIERVIDGKADETRVLAVSTDKAAEMLGIDGPNRKKTVEKYIREKKLVRSTPGHVTVASIEAFLARKAAA